jgi:uncharacterized membrane protein YgcG
MQRIWRHLLTARWRLRRLFPPAALAAIEASIHAAEREHSGEIRFVIEPCLDWWRLRDPDAARRRAREVFAQLGVWDTHQNNGVLIYLLLADQDIEIVADRGLATRVGDREWEEVCRCMENEFRAGHFESGALAGIRRTAALIARHFPPVAGDRNELPDAPVLLR